MVGMRIRGRSVSTPAAAPYTAGAAKNTNRCQSRPKVMVSATGSARTAARRAKVESRRAGGRSSQSGP
jgi:hypothetical protein